MKVINLLLQNRMIKFTEADKKKLIQKNNGFIAIINPI